MLQSRELSHQRMLGRQNDEGHAEYRVYPSRKCGESLLGEAVLGDVELDLDTLAAAQAANGDFVVAVKTVDAAIGLALVAKDKTMIKLLQGRREGYLEKRPYRETLPVNR